MFVYVYSLKRQGIEREKKSETIKRKVNTWVVKASEGDPEGPEDTPTKTRAGRRRRRRGNCNQPNRWSQAPPTSSGGSRWGKRRRTRRENGLWSSRVSLDWKNYQNENKGDKLKRSGWRAAGSMVSMDAFGPGIKTLRRRKRGLVYGIWIRTTTKLSSSQKISCHLRSGRGEAATVFLKQTDVSDKSAASDILSQPLETYWCRDEMENVLKKTGRNNGNSWVIANDFETCPD